MKPEFISTRWIEGPVFWAAFFAAGALLLPAYAPAASFRADTSVDESRCRVVFSWSDTRQTGPSADELPAAATHSGEAIQVAFERPIDADAVDTLPMRLPGCVRSVMRGNNFVELATPSPTEFRVAKADGQVIVDIVKPLAAPPAEMTGDNLMEQVEEALNAGRLDALADLMDEHGAAKFEERPLLAASAFTALQRRDEALEWMARAENKTPLRLDELLHLASLHHKLAPEGNAPAHTSNLVTLLVAALKNAPEERRGEIAFSLIELKADEAALPLLLQLANELGGDWVFAYAEAGKRLGRDEEVTRFWAARAKLPDLSPSEKRDIGFLLLEDNKQAAIEVFRELANTEPPDGQNVSQLLFLWGPRPGREARDWLVARGRAAQDAERAGWMRHLMNLGAAEDATAVVEGTVPHHTGVLDIYLEALAETKDGPAAANAIRQHLAAENRVERLEHFAEVAEGLDEYAIARDVRLKLIGLEPNAPRHLKALGYAEANLKHWPAAGEYLKRYLEKEKGDWEVNYQYAEAAFILENFQEARTYYSRTLEMMKDVQTPPFNLRVARANCLNRLGQEQESVSAFEGLLAERPRDSSVRVSYIAALMEQGKYHRAKELLGQP